MQFQGTAGYILKPFRSAIGTASVSTGLGNILARSCCFEIGYSSTNDHKDSPELAIIGVAANLLMRGAPTNASARLQQQFISVFPAFFENGRPILKDPKTIVSQLPSLLLPYDPRITLKKVLQRLQHTLPSATFKILIPALHKALGPAALQLLKTENTSAVLHFPVTSDECDGLLFSSNKDDNIPIEGNWIRIPVGMDADEFNSRLTGVIAKHSANLQPFITAGKNNFLLSAEKKNILQILHSPLGIARIQNVVLHCISSGKLQLTEQEWNITVIERDVPCAALALDDLTSLLENLFLLEGAGRSLPRINLRVYTTKEFADSPLHALATNRPIILESEILPTSDSVLIDSAMLLIQECTDTERQNTGATTLELRSMVSGKDTRSFNSNTMLVYKGLGQLSTTGRELSPEVRSVLLRLLYDLFGYADFKAGQAELLARCLSGEHLVAAMPPGSGKTLPVLFSALLQSAMTLMIAPSSDLLSDTMRTLNDAGIDCCVLPCEEDRREIRLISFGRIAAKKSLITLIPASLFLYEDVRNTLDEAYRNGIALARVVIDEADCGSEWGHDPRFPMQHITHRVCTSDTSSTRHLPIAMLTASMSPRVHRHLLYQIAAAQKLRKPETSWLCLHLGALPPSVRLIPIFSKTKNRLGIVEEITNLLTHIPAILQNQHSDKRKDGDFTVTAFNRTLPSCNDDAVVVFVPEPEDVSQQYSAGNKGLFELLKSDTLRPARYTGSDYEGMATDRQTLCDAAKERRKFANGDANLLVTTRAWGLGSHRDGVRAVIHTQFPASLPHFLQECGRAGRDGKAAACFVFIPADEVISPGAGQRNKTLSRLRFGLSTAVREKQILNDIFKEITYQEDSNTARIANQLNDEFGTKLYTSYWHRNLDERLYVQDQNAASLGYIDLVACKVEVNPAFTDQPLAREALDYAFTKSMSEAGKGQSLSAWVAATFPSNADDGLLRQMKDFDVGSRFTLHIGFENDKEPILNQIQSILWRRAEIQIQRKILSEIPVETWDDFSEELEKRTQQPGLFARIDKELSRTLQQLYLKIRSQADTERAIARLMTLGAISDVVASPVSRKFVLTVNVRRDSEYHEALEQYLRMLMTEKNVHHILQTLPTYSGNTALEQCLYFLIDHCYRWIGEQHENATDDVASLLHSINIHNNNEHFHETAVHSTTSRYARPGQLPKALTLHGNEQLQILLRITEELDAYGPVTVSDNLEYLRRSGNTLLTVYPHSALLQFLPALADFIDPPAAYSSTDIQKHFTDAMLLCLSLSYGTPDECITTVQRLGTILRKYSEDEAIRAVVQSIRERISELPTLRSIHETDSINVADTDSHINKAASIHNRKSAIAPATLRHDPTTEAPIQSPESPELPQESPVIPTRKAKRLSESDHSPERISASPDRELPHDHSRRESRTDRSRTPPAIQPTSRTEETEPSNKRTVNIKSEQNIEPQKKQTLKEEPVVDTKESNSIVATEHFSAADFEHNLIVEDTISENTTEAVDTDILTHLHWLITFNHSFLKNYEAGNE